MSVARTTLSFDCKRLQQSETNDGVNNFGTDFLSTAIAFVGFTATVVPRDCNKFFAIKTRSASTSAIDLVANDKRDFILGESVRL